MNTFLNHIQLKDKAVNADKRKFTVKDEAPRHFIDIDAYSVDSPLAVLPKNGTMLLQSIQRIPY